MTSLGNKEVMAKNLSYYLERKGKTQAELADVVGVSPATLSFWIKGKKYPRIDKIEIMANYFGILKSDLIEDREDMERKNDILTDIVIRMRGDDEFLNLVATLHELDSEQITGVRLMLKALLK